MLVKRTISSGYTGCAADKLAETEAQANLSMAQSAYHKSARDKDRFDDRIDPTALLGVQLSKVSKHWDRAF